MNLRSAILIVLLALGAAGSWYLAWQHRDEGDTAASAGAPHRGYYLESARILGTGEDGRLLYAIEAQRAEQQPDNAIAFSDVRVSYSPQTDVPWVVTADSATIDEQRERVLLSGHVKAVRSGTDSDTEIRTQYLELRPEAYLAETDRRVQIRIGERSLTATGMLASLEDNRLELKSNVSGKFFP